MAQYVNLWSGRGTRTPIAAKQKNNVGLEQPPGGLLIKSVDSYSGGGGCRIEPFRCSFANSVIQPVVLDTSAGYASPDLLIIPGVFESRAWKLLRLLPQLLPFFNGKCRRVPDYVPHCFTALLFYFAINSSERLLLLVISRPILFSIIKYLIIYSVWLAK